jgi:hypothetical protein
MSCIEEIDHILKGYNRNRYNTFVSLQHLPSFITNPIISMIFFFFSEGKSFFNPAVPEPYNSSHYRCVE